jgi:hypothetical protein
MVPLSFKANPKPELHAISVDLDTRHLLLSNLLTLIGDQYLADKTMSFSKAKLRTSRIEPSTFGLALLTSPSASVHK